MSGQDVVMPAEPPRLLGRDYWLIPSTPVAGTTQEAIDACAGQHIAWLLGLERMASCSCPGRCCPAREPGLAPG